MVFDNPEDAKTIKSIGVNVAVLVGVTVALIVLALALGNIY